MRCLRAALFGAVGGGRGLCRGVEPTSGVAVDGPGEDADGVFTGIGAQRAQGKGAGWWARWLGAAVRHGGIFCSSRRCFHLLR